MIKKLNAKTNRKKKELENDYIQQKVTEKKQKPIKTEAVENVKEKPTKESIAFFKICK